MSDQPTPETDASQHEGLLRGNAMPTQVVHVNFARKLERERDEAREAIRVLAEHGESEIQRITKERDEWAKLCGQYKQERDEARGALASREVVLAQQRVITDLILERDQARAVLQEIEAARWHTACELRRIATGALGNLTIPTK